MSHQQTFPLKNKKVLLVGLGLLGGGLSTALWLLKKGAKLTITDLQSKKELSPSLEKLKKYKNKIKFVLKKHQKEDFLKNELIVINPAVKTFNNPYLTLAQKKKIPIENELTLFIQYFQNKNKDNFFNQLIAITGTRGKTTTSHWLFEFLSLKYKPILALNNPDFPLLSLTNLIKNFENPIILEIPSYHLELVKNFSPKMAIITNLYPDHLNRYQNIKKYAQVKANIFKSQSSNDYLILNKDNPWTKFFLSLKPKAQVYFISKKPLPSFQNGIFLLNNYLYFQFNQKRKRLFSVKKFIKKWGLFNIENLMEALLAAYLFNLDFKTLKNKIPLLKPIKFRQEEIFSNKYVKIINDSAATIPEATIIAIKKFSKDNLILITGGTDVQLNFKDLAKEIKNNISKGNLILLNDSATQKLIQELKKIRYHQFFVYETLKECVLKAKELIKNKKGIILFSPGAKSFNKFKNEYHRGEVFNNLIKEIF
ncbi:MAG: UDP-N-acetylmuramoyl-L-alanine--D-glutamate ligase [Candidatus Paceibacterota bacterium]